MRMQIIRSIAVLIPVVVFSGSGFAHGSVDQEVRGVIVHRMVAPLDDLTRAATRVAKIRIVDRRTQMLAGVSCGYVYRAEVLEGFKGGSTDFEFLITAEEDFRGFEIPYLVFVFSRDAINEVVSRFLDSALTQHERRLISCRLLQELYTPGGFKTIWSIDPEMSQKLGGDWLELDTRPAVEWCTSNDRTLSDSADQRFIERDGQYYRTVRWESVRKWIVRAINEPMKQPNCLPTSAAAGSRF